LKLLLVILISKHHKTLHKYEDIIQNLSRSKSLYLLEKNSNSKLHSVVDVIGDHTEIHLLLKVLYNGCTLSYISFIDNRMSMKAYL